VSILQTIDIGDHATPVVIYKAKQHFEAPNWTRDGRYLIFDEAGKIMRVAAIANGTPEALEIGAATRCNGSHGLSPDGSMLAISCSMPEMPESRVYILPSSGGVPHIVTQTGGSYWHSWSPDGKTILFTRPDHHSINIYAIGTDGSSERPLTSGTGTSDDPDYSPDGRYIYFNSDRSGSMQIWRMHPDGSSPEQVTNDDRVNWTPHVSPDGKFMVYISYPKGTTGHPANQNVELRLMSLRDRRVKTLTALVGGSGTMNVPSWAPDSHHLAFVSYELLASQ
jgi:Tol biopolymer transport system component